jgi:predicted RNase H-like nuclease
MGMEAVGFGADGTPDELMRAEMARISTLLVGFDSAWTPGNVGAIVAVLDHDDGTCDELGPPQTVDFSAAMRAVDGWQAAHSPTATVVFLDQPTLVANAGGQRPVENIVGSPVGRRHGGMQPANTGKSDMFGAAAPVWRFLKAYGGPADPLTPLVGTRVVETYPVLTMIALGWMLPDTRRTGRLPKYNPERKATFSLGDWRHVCQRAAGAFRLLRLAESTQWLDDASEMVSPRKLDQDRLDSYLCLLAALHFARGRECLMAGNQQSGYIVVPDDAQLRLELEHRCLETRRPPPDWVRAFRVRGNVN